MNIICSASREYRYCLRAQLSRFQVFSLKGSMFPEISLIFMNSCIINVLLHCFGFHFRRSFSIFPRAEICLFRIASSLYFALRMTSSLCCSYSRRSLGVLLPGIGKYRTGYRDINTGECENIESKLCENALEQILLGSNIESG